MNVLLVSPRTREAQELHVPQGLLQLHAVLSNAGHSCRLLDMNNPGVDWNAALRTRPDVVGFSVTTPQLAHAVELVADLDVSIPVVWGGVHALLDPASILRRFPAHWVVRGDGEQPLLDLLEWLQGRRDREWMAARPGLAFVEDGEERVNPPWFAPDLDMLPDVDFGALPHLERYVDMQVYYVRERVRGLPILTSRGCHWNCAFCINTLIARNGGRYRSKSIAKIRRETERWLDALDLDFLFPRDEDFFGNRPLVAAWESYAAERGFLWGANCRFNYFAENLLTEDRLGRLVEHGLCEIGMSVETGDETVRNTVLRKQVRDADIDRALRAIGAGVGRRLVVNTSFITGFPGETPRSRTQTIVFMDRLSRGLNVTFSGPQAYRPYPGSELWERGGTHPQGDIAYYLRQADETSRPSENWFYTQLLPKYFNERFRPFHIVRTGGHRRLEPACTAVSGFRRAWVRMLAHVLFLSIRLRIRMGVWAAFVEPEFLAVLHRVRQNVGHSMRRGRVPV